MLIVKVEKKRTNSMGRIVLQHVFITHGISIILFPIPTNELLLVQGYLCGHKVVTFTPLISRSQIMQRPSMSLMIFRACLSHFL